jgi:L-alanine-DL-glutamate epimerase-like enolase superfamily enzyme
MKIRSVRASVLRIPLARQPAFATRQLTHRDYALIRVETEGGVEGIAYCLEGVLVSAAVTELLGPLLVGEDPFDTRRLWDRMFRASLQVGRRGAVLRAISCIDIALWDIRGKATGLPVHKLLGSFRDEVPAYASGGYYFPGENSLEGLVAEVRDYVERGFDAVKIKIGRLEPWPKRAGVRDMFLAALYAMTEPIEAPTPGRMPTQVPMSDERIRLKAWRRQSLSDMRRPFIDIWTRSTLRSISTMSAMIWLTANTPIRTGRSFSPAFSM